MAQTLVIGGTGLIGRPLVEALLSRGDEVTILHRGQGTPFGGRVVELHADRNDAEAVRNVLGRRSFDRVFDNVYDWARGTTAEQVIATARAASSRAGRYVFTSSVAVYPPGGPFDEEAELVPASHPSLYGAQKAESERALFRFGGECGLPVSTLRPAFVYGAFNLFEREAFFWDRLVAGRSILLPDDGGRTMQWVYATDVARAAIGAATIDAAAGKAFNLPGELVTQAEYVRLLARAAGVEAKLVPVPRETIEAAGGSVLTTPLYFGHYLDVPPITVTGDRARTLLGLETTPLVDGLRDTFEWYRAQDRPPPDTAWEDQVFESASPR